MIAANPAPGDQTSGISAPTEREAMDWSLVLLSQGIEPTLLRDDTNNAWQLVIPSQHFDAGRDSIRLYEQENRAWPFRHPLPWPGFAFDWTVLAWATLLAVFYALQTQPDSDMEAAGICSAKLVRAGEWWRLLTATLLHANVGHLASNAVFGVLLLGLVMGRFGAGVGLLAAHLAGAAGNAFPLLWRGDTSAGLGASGVVLAALGLLAADAVVFQVRHHQPRRFLIGAMAGGLMLFVLIGVAPGSDVAAHLGGFLAGLMIGAPLALAPLTAIRKARWNWLAGVTFAALIITAWWLALRR